MKFSWLKEEGCASDLIVREELPVVKALECISTGSREFVNVLVVSKNPKQLGKVILDSNFYFPEKMSITLVDNNMENLTLRKLDTLSSRSSTLVFLDSPDKENHKTTLAAMRRYPGLFKYTNIYAF